MHISFSRSNLFFSLSLLLLVGCQVITPPNFPTAPTTPPVTVEPSPTAAPEPTISPVPPSAGPDVAMLRGATYAVEQVQSGSAPLVNGEYREPSIIVAGSETVVTFYQSAQGDLNQDGVQDAAVVLNINTGGTARFYYLYAATLQNGSLVLSAPVFLGDGTMVNTLEIVQGVIHLGMLRLGPNDPLCCPSQSVSAAYRYQDGQLVVVNP